MMTKWITHLAVPSWIKQEKEIADTSARSRYLPKTGELYLRPQGVGYHLGVWIFKRKVRTVSVGEQAL